MIKISANISKKVPIPGTEYSSQQFGASLEIEVSDADKPELIQGRIRDLYGVLGRTIDEQIANAGQNGNGTSASAAQPATSAPVNRVASSGSQNTGNGSGNGRKTNATGAQQRAIFAICKSLALDVAAFLAPYNVTDPAQLPIKIASQIIDDLKGRQNAATTRQ